MRSFTVVAQFTVDRHRRSHHHHQLWSGYAVSACLCMFMQHGEEIQTLQKRITHLETDLEQAKTQLTETNEKLEDANKSLSNVRTIFDFL